MDLVAQDGHAKVGKEHLAIRPQVDIAGLEVTMPDLVGVGVLQGLGHLSEDVQDLTDGEGSALSGLLQVWPGDEGEGDPEALFVLPHLQGRDDAGVPEPLDALKLPIVVVDQALLIAEVGAKALHGYL